MSFLTRISTRGAAGGLIIGAGLWDVFRSYMYDVVRIMGPSMAPSLNPDFQENGACDYVRLHRNMRVTTDYREFGGTGASSLLQRGMIVLFRSPLTGKPTIKRVVALQGDCVKPFKRSGKLVSGLERGQEEEVTVPFGHVWVEGDQVDRRKTLDSNDYGPISKSLIEGVATRVVMPFSRRGPLSISGEWEERCRDRIKKSKDDDVVPEEWRIF